MNCEYANRQSDNLMKCKYTNKQNDRLMKFE